MDITLTLMFAGAAPGTQGTLPNQMWQDALTLYANRHTAPGVTLELPSRDADLDHDLHVTLTGSNEIEIRDAYLQVPSFPENLKLSLKKIRVHRSYTDEAKHEVEKILQMFATSVPLEVIEEAKPVLSSAKGG